MKICILANAESVHTQRWAKSYADRGNEVHLLSIRSVSIPSVYVHTVKLGPQNSNSSIWKFLSYLYLALTGGGRIRKIKPDVVNAYYVSTYGVIAAFAGFHPLVISVWGNDVIPIHGTEMPKLLQIFIRYALKRADLVCSTSKFMAKQALKIQQPKKEIEVVPFGIDCEVFKPTGKPKEFAIEFRIGFVKALSKIYGLDYLIQAMPKICESIPNAKLIVIGKDYEMLKDKLVTLCEKLGVSKNIEFKGFVPKEQIPQLMNSFDVLVNPTIVEESFGVVILEAQACGIPVVATNVGGVPEVCIDGKTALLVTTKDANALADKIILLAKDTALRQKMGKEGREFVLKNYNWQSNIDKMLELFSEITDNRF